MANTAHTGALVVRPAHERDAAAMLAIYAPVVEHTAISFEDAVPSLAEFTARLRKYLEGWRAFVAEDGGAVVGYAYGSAHRERAAYRWSVETTVYVAAGQHRRGVGRALYQTLLPELAAAGFCNVYAGVALPNDASVAAPGRRLHPDRHVPARRLQAWRVA